MLRQLLVAVTALLLITCQNAVGRTDEKKSLDKEDKAFLKKLIGNPLTDPAGKEFVTVEVTVRSCWGTQEKERKAGWLAKSSGREAIVHFADGHTVAADQTVKVIDYPAIEKLLAAGEREYDQWGKHRDKPGLRAVLFMPKLVRAAWLMRLGHEKFASKLYLAMQGDTPEQRSKAAEELSRIGMLRGMRESLAWDAYSDAVHAQMHAADEEALLHVERMLRLYPEYAKEFGDATRLAVDLKRRKKSKGFNSMGVKQPVEFNNWNKLRQANWLISQLDNVAERQFSQPGGVNLMGDWRVEALIKIGSPAVVPLIDAVEKDNRLTRSVHFWRAHEWLRTTLSVREAALVAVINIIRISVFEPHAIGYTFTSSTDKQVRHVVTRLRDYWKKFGHLTLEQQMMKILLEKESTVENTR